MMVRRKLPDELIRRLYLDELRTYPQILAALKNQGIIISVGTLRRYLHRVGIWQTPALRYAQRPWLRKNLHPERSLFIPGKEHPNWVEGRWAMVNLETKVCPFCMATFQPKIAKQIYCGKDCANDANHPRSERIKKLCPICRTQFITTGDKRETKYCSHECSMKVRIRDNKRRHRELFENRVRQVHKEGFGLGASPAIGRRKVDYETEIERELIRRFPNYRRNKQPMSKSVLHRIIKGKRA